LAGQLLGERYRIVQRLGQGGMGEVYRADDLELGQAVALKFLPERLTNDDVALDQLRGEVRLARSVAHANVCRVYDIGQADGHFFISMEYVDGEDLADALRRMGRPSREKALVLARQICMGLAAAHETGILHRDLKPANIMIDGRGRARITDFGLARLSSDDASVDQVVGTLNYMSPEQLSRGESTIQSDLYSLGLILHEMFTGEAVHRGKSVQEVLAAHESSSGTRPSDILPDIDPVIDRVIGRCLERDAHDRPRSAQEVAAALPGGDALAAALAAGETPSPEMVAAAGTKGLLSPGLGAALLVVLGICLIGHPFLSDSRSLVTRASLPKNPDVLAAEAQELIREFGYEVEGQDQVFWMRADFSYIRHLGREYPGPDRWNALENEPPSAHHFWFRQSHRPIRQALDGVFLSRVNQVYPPPRSGTIDLKLDMQGRLVSFVARPPRVEELASPSKTELPWDRLFELTGLDRTRFRPSENPIDPVWNIPVDCDQRWTWMGTLSDENPLAIRVEAGSIRGRLAAFQVVPPWSVPPPGSGDAALRSVNLVGETIEVIVILIIGILAAVGVRNFRRGRGDRRGSLRIGLFIVTSHMGFWLLGSSRLPQVIGGFISTATLALAISLFWGVGGWLFYMAMEPYLRRQCPHRIISWSRLLAGRWRDPLAGRDMLVGITVGAALSVGGSVLVVLIRSAMNLPDAFSAGSPALGVHQSLASLMVSGHDAAAGGLLAMFVPLVVQFVVRKAWIAVVLTWVMFTLAFSMPLWNADSIGAWAILALVVAGLRAAAFLYLLLRVGLLAGAAFAFVSIALGTTGSSSLGEWHGQPTLTTILVIACLGSLGFVHALAGRKFFRDSLDSPSP